ncbi:MAG: biotin--[acetyl-CoA-carboxylase] ligase [Clostridia bacterium]
MNLEDKVLQLLEENKDKYFSGEQLALTFDVSRNAVWKAINCLKTKGHEVATSPKLGYCLSGKSQVVTEFCIEKYLSNKGFFDVEVRQQVSSTNTLLKAAAVDGERQGKVVVALSQTAGRGRQNRSFYSPSNCGIYFSVLLRPTLPIEDCGNLTALAGVAVAENIEKFVDKPVGIKWVNDIILDNKKLCGILTEAEIDVEVGAYKYVVVGIGINLKTPSGGYGELKDIATSVFGEAKYVSDDVGKLVAGILDSIYESYQKLPNKDFIKRYQCRQVLVGEKVELLRCDEPYARGKVLEVDDNCGLVVKLDDGEIKTLSSGEAKVIRRL